jgi:hypothetical protein
VKDDRVPTWYREDGHVFIDLTLFGSGGVQADAAHGAPVGQCIASVAVASL